MFQLSKPLYSFENATDYVFDVKWSPIHPAVFASADAMGKVDIWNINTDTEVRCNYVYWQIVATIHRTYNM